MSIVSSSGMLVKKESISRFHTQDSESCLIISSVSSNESSTAYSLLVNDFKIGAGNFVNLWVGILIVDKKGQKRGHILMMYL